MSFSTLSSIFRPGVSVSGVAGLAFFVAEMEQAGVVALVGLAEQRQQVAGRPPCRRWRCAARPSASMPRSSQMRRKMMRSMVSCTAQFSSRVVSAGLRRAMLRASSSRQRSISARKASSTSAVPFLPFRPTANWSSEP